LGTLLVDKRTIFFIVLLQTVELILSGSPAGLLNKIKKILTAMMPTKTEK